MSEPKRFKHDYASLELLPNELFVEIFGYLNGVDTIYAFSQLNNRFQSLLNNYVNIIDFKSISKAKFDFVTRQQDMHQWRSLRLSDDDRTPGQIKLFCQLFPPAEYVSQLQSLSAANMKPKYTQELFSHFRSLDHLVSLTIGKMCGEKIQPMNLPLLKRLVIASCKHTDWMMKLHSLESMEYTVEYKCHRDNILTLPTTLKELKMLYKVEHHASGVQSSLCQLSQLTKLSLYDNGSYSLAPDGRKWEEFIQSSLPLLTIFQFCFPFQCFYGTSVTVDEVVASFSTPFYLIEKRWFIRCNLRNVFAASGILYSLPFAFAEMPINILSYVRSMSTLSASNMSETKSNSYVKVKTLVGNEECQEPIRDFPTSSIVKLVLKTSLPTKWLSLLTNVRSLEFSDPINITSTEFASLLLHIPQLQSLKLPFFNLIKLTDRFTNNVVCDQLSQRIQSLIISEYFSGGHELGTITFRQFLILVRIFGQKLQHVSLAVSEHSNTVLPVLRRMRQLRSLHIRFDAGRRTSRDTARCWLRQPLAGSTVPDFIQVTDDNNLYIWFGNAL